MTRYLMTLVLCLAVTAVAAQNLTSFYENGKYGFKDESGKVVIAAKYEFARSFSDGLGAVKLNGKWGFVDKSAMEIIPIIYQYVSNFSQGLAAVRTEDRWGCIDKTMKEIVPQKYDNIDLLSIDPAITQRFAAQGNIFGGFIFFSLSATNMNSVCQVIKYHIMADDADYLYFDLDMWEKQIIVHYMKGDHTDEANLAPLIDYMKKHSYEFKCVSGDLIVRQTGILEMMLLTEKYDVFNRFLERYQPDLKAPCDPFGRTIGEMLDSIIITGTDNSGTFYNDQKERFIELREKIRVLEREGYPTE